MSQRLKVGAQVQPRELSTLSGERIRVPHPSQLVHLQFRRFAGCPACNLHLRDFIRRAREIEAASVREVVLFHSSAEELRHYDAQLPPVVVADPDKQLYRAFGVEAGLRALLDPRAVGPILRAVLHTLGEIVRGRAPLRLPRVEGGRLGLPADFLIAPDGRVLACKYGEYVDDQWSVDELIAQARAAVPWSGTLLATS
jgi:peroxiredoxin